MGMSDNLTTKQELGELARDLTAMCAKSKLVEMVNGLRAQHAESTLHTNQDIAIGAVCLAHRAGHSRAAARQQMTA
jgi:hypothetical protein